MSTIANRIKDLRIVRGLTQEEAADAINVSRPTYVLIENGRRELTLSELNKLASAFNISVGELLYDVAQIQTNDFGFAKYKEMILNSIKYGADSDGKITKTKLAKLVYLADFAWFYENLESMSGLQYRRIPQGPVPDAYFRAIEELYADESISIECKGKAFLVESLEAPTAEELSRSELDLIKKISTAWRGKKTEAIVDFTHNQLPWKICRPGEIIPYELITQEDPGHVY